MAGTPNSPPGSRRRPQPQQAQECAEDEDARSVSQCIDDEWEVALHRLRSVYYERRDAGTAECRDDFRHGLVRLRSGAWRVNW